MVNWFLNFLLNLWIRNTEKALQTIQKEIQKLQEDLDQSEETKMFSYLNSIKTIKKSKYLEGLCCP